MARGEITDLLAAVGNLRERRQEGWHENATRFNIFDALNVEYKELSHSKFLAFLLNPSQRHDQGDRFLRSFLALFDIPVPGSLERVEVITEHPISQYGRLDVLIRIPSVLTICIENKIGARDQQDQIRSYLDWLMWLPSGSDIRAVVYMTPPGRYPQAPLFGVDDGQLRLLSYARVADWVESQSQSLPMRLRTVAEMYVQTCRKIAGVSMVGIDDDDMCQLLTTPEHFTNALEIARSIEQEEPRVIARFWQNVRELLLTRLVSENLANKWAIEISPKLVGESWLAIMSLGAGVDSDCHPAGYAIMSGRLSSAKAYYGIRRNLNSINSPGPIDEEITEELTDVLHFNASRFFCGDREFADEGIFPSSRDLSEWLVQLNVDNHEPNTPLAANVAKDMWELMLRFRGRLEELNAP